LATIVFQKVTHVTSHPLYHSMCSKCPPLARMQAVNIDTLANSRPNNLHFTK